MSKKEKFTDIRLLVIGLGPYCLFTHLSILLEKKVYPIAIVELQSRINSVRIILGTLGLKNVDLIPIPDAERDLVSLSARSKKRLSQAISEHRVTHVIISTEPKAHYSYLDFFIRKKIPIFCDKPIFVFKEATTNRKVSLKIKSSFNKLLNLTDKFQTPVYINTKRREHDGYRFIKDLICSVATKYKIAPTSLEISASDGMWNFPNEYYERENHPYKYGYGKIFHSGYHFVDLISYLIEEPLKKVHSEKIKIDAKSFSLRPNDSFEVLGGDFYKQFFKDQDFKKKISLAKKIEGYGELDVFSILKIKNSKGSPLVHVSLNLMNTSFSRRSWPTLPIDTYKSNGRVRHERVNIQIGPLMNIQLHEYGSLEGTTSEEAYPISEVTIFRNSGLIGGKPFERIELRKLSKKEINLVSEEEKALTRFLNLSPSTSMLKDHLWSHELLSRICLSLSCDFELTRSAAEI